MKQAKNDDRPPDEEVAHRRDAALLRALSTPHKKQADMKLGDKKRKSGTDTKSKNGR